MQHLSKRLTMWAIIVAVLLMIPLIAMRFTDQVNWSVNDFIFAGVLFFGTALAYELVSRRIKSSAYRFAVGIAAVSSLLLIWINGAVGIIGNEDNPANLMYGGVLVVGLIGAVIARLKPRGMARTLFVMAAAQIAVPVIALFTSDAAITSEPPGLYRVISLNAFFAIAFVISGLLFQQADETASARQQTA